MIVMEDETNNQRPNNNETAKNVFRKSCKIMGEEFDLEERYNIVDFLGSGAYGVVCAAEDKKENKVVAIKKCKKIFNSRTLAKRTLREIRILRLLDHDNIVKLQSIVPPEHIKSFSELYLVFELMDTDLAQVIRSKQVLLDSHVQYFSFQLLSALSYIHGANIIHRDIKPRNILINASCELKLADFGLARILRPEDAKKANSVAITDYVTTRWYRAPEVISGWATYSSAVDMWAVGCIIAELVLREPLFPGADTMKQMGLICALIGKPSQHFISCCRKKAYRSYLNSLTRSFEMTAVELFLPRTNSHTVDLILSLLDYNPDNRPTANECLLHSYFSKLRNIISYRETFPYIDKHEFAFEGYKPTIEELKKELISEVSYHNKISHSKVVEPLIISPLSFSPNDATTDGSLGKDTSSISELKLQSETEGSEESILKSSRSLVIVEKNLSYDTAPTELIKPSEVTHITRPAQPSTNTENQYQLKLPTILEQELQNNDAKEKSEKLLFSPKKFEKVIVPVFPDLPTTPGVEAKMETKNLSVHKRSLSLYAEPISSHSPLIQRLEKTADFMQPHFPSQNNQLLGGDSGINDTRKSQSEKIPVSKIIRHRRNGHTSGYLNIFTCAAYESDGNDLDYDHWYQEKRNVTEGKGSRQKRVEGKVDNFSTLRSSHESGPQDTKKRHASSSSCIIA